MKINVAKLIPLCLMLAGLGLGAALLLDEQQDAPRVGSTSNRVKSNASKPKPSRARLVARASERAPELEHGEPAEELALADELEALRSLTRAEAAEDRRHDAALAQANRRVLYTQNLTRLETAAGEAELAGDATRAEALRKRIELLSERAREEEHGEN
jgi:hypothetical protein